MFLTCKFSFSLQESKVIKRKPPFLLGISMLLFRHQYHVSVYAKLLIKQQISTEAFTVTAIIYVEGTEYKGMTRMLYMDCSEFCPELQRPGSQHRQGIGATISSFPSHLYANEHFQLMKLKCRLVISRDIQHHGVRTKFHEEREVVSKNHQQEEDVAYLNEKCRRRYSNHFLFVRFPKDIAYLSQKKTQTTES